MRGFAHALALAAMLQSGLAAAADPPWHERCRSQTLQAALAGALADTRGEWATRVDSADWVAAAAPLPAHCHVQGIIGAHVGPPGATAYGNRFRLRLPADWNARLVFQGGGGNNGVLGDALAMGKDGRTALERGFAVIAQDSGHQGREPHFALDAQAYRDFAWTGVHKAAVVGKALIAAVAGERPRRSYFVGCSNGGREALAAAQRQDEFDGVVSGAPGLATYDQWLHNLFALRVVARVAGVPAGQPVADTSAAFSDAQLAAVADHFMRKCDPLDGLTDGLIAHPEACLASAADWLALSCPAHGGSAPAASCLSDRQALGLRQIHDGARDSRGRLLWPGFYPGHIERAMRPTYLGLPGSARPWGGFYESVMRNFVFMGYGHQGWPGANGPRDQLASYPTDARAYVAGFDFDTEPARLEPGRADFHADRPEAFEAFRRRGGRMLLYTGTMDPGVQPAGIAGFMRRLQQHHGREAADAMSALFLVPGMGHCRGGAATEVFDPLGALVDWVEQGLRPARLEARAVPGGPLDADRRGFSRPLCAWPQVARWRGEGDARSAASFTCAAP